MTRYHIREESSNVSIELTEVAGHQQELLQTFQECQQGRCSCPTNEYQKVASMEVVSEHDQIGIRLQSKPGTRLNSSEIARCLEHTIGNVDRAG